MWNYLPNDVRLAESFPQFKGLLHAWDGDADALLVQFRLCFTPCFCSIV